MIQYSSRTPVGYNWLIDNSVLIIAIKYPTVYGAIVWDICQGDHRIVNYSDWYRYSWLKENYENNMFWL